MKFQHPAVEIQKIRVYHENNHFCGEIKYDKVWNEYRFYPKSSGLRDVELEDIAKYVKRLTGYKRRMKNFFRCLFYVLWGGWIK